MAETLKKRNEIPEELKWDTSRIFKDSEDLKANLEKFKKLTDEIEADYKGKLTDADKINECLEKYNQWIIMADHLINYTNSVEKQNSQVF